MADNLETAQEVAVTSPSEAPKKTPKAKKAAATEETHGVLTDFGSAQFYIKG